MPLSEHEERALEEIARRLSEEDPSLAATVSNTTVASVELRRLRWSVIGFVVGLLLLLSLVVHLALGLAGFALMLTSVVMGGRAVRKLGARALLEQLSDRRRRDGDRR